MTQAFEGLTKHEFILTEYTAYKTGMKVYTFENDNEDRIQVEVFDKGLITINTRGDITIEAMREVIAIDWEAI